MLLSVGQRGLAETYAYCAFAGRDLAFVRLLGPGLGNLLFPWSRFHVTKRVLGVPGIAPTWPQIKIGPFLRRDHDLRGYAGLFLPAPDDIVGSRRVLLITLGRRIGEEPITDDQTAFLAGRRPVLLTHSGSGGHFLDLAQHSELVRTGLRAITRPQHLGEAPLTHHVAAHVRRGDFVSIGNATSGSWFEGVVRSLRRLGLSATVRVFTDGTARDVGPLLEMDGVELVQPQSAIADLWSMSQARLIVASGGSTFSAWAAFLGGRPSIWPRGSNTHGLELARPDEVFMCDPSDDAGLLRALDRAFPSGNRQPTNPI